MGVGLAFAAIVSTFILRFAYSYSNKKRDKVSEDEIRSKYTEDEMLGKLNLRESVLLLTVVEIWETRVRCTDMSYEALKSGPYIRHSAVRRTRALVLYLGCVLDCFLLHIKLNLSKSNSVIRFHQVTSADFVRTHLSRMRVEVGSTRLTVSEQIA
jgi:hypothetical protein